MSPAGYGIEVYFAPAAAPLLDAEAVRDAIRHVLAAEHIAQAEISVAFLGDAEIAALNERHLAHAGPTDVISFALHPPGAPPVGDIYIGAAQARRQAEELGVSPAEECLRLAIHGVLHVLGYDHPEGEDRADSRMYQQQEALLGAFTRDE